MQPSPKQSLSETLLSRLPSRLSGFVQAGARARLLNGVDAVVLLHEARVYDLANGRWQALAQESESEGAADEAERIASAVVALLQAREKAPSVLLLLPSTHFIASEVNMPGMTGETLRAALRLQSSLVLPGYDTPLAFALNSSAATAEGSHIVLWTDALKLNALFEACEKQGIFLAGVMPRVLACGDSTAGEMAILDEDESTLSSIRYRDGVLSRFLQIPRDDLQDEAFARQWREHSSPVDMTTLLCSSAQDYVERAASINANNAYSFVPSGAEKVMQRTAKRRRMGVSIAAAIVLLFLAASPLLWQSLQMLRLQSQLNALQERSVQAREDQAAVRAFERDWGVLTEFPQQNLPQTLLQMQAVLSHGVLSSVEVDEGTVEIEGESQDPQSLLQLLEENSLFTGADFARATNNDRYYIEFRLSTVDFDAYRERYFPDQRR